LGFGVVTFTAKDLGDPKRQLPRAVFLALGIATVIYVAVAIGTFGTLTVGEVIASGGTALAVALLVFAMVGIGHLRVRSETGANLLLALAAIASALIVLVTFAFTTLVEEPATAVTLVAILLVSVALDVWWKQRRTGSL
jgi:amino acid transporter